MRKSRIVLARKCARQSTSMPALHGRNVPNCRPMADGGMRKCSAGACPPQGSGWGEAESAVPIRCIKPQFRLFKPWCAGTSRHERLVRKHVPDYDPGCPRQSTSMPALHGRNVPNCRPMADGGMRKCSAGACPPQGSGWGEAESAVPIRCTKPQLRLFIPWCAGTSRHERLVRKHVPDSEFVILAEAGIQRGRVAPTTPKHLQRPGLIFIPRCAGTSRHKRLVRKHVPASDPGRIPAPAGDTNHRRPNNDSRGSQERNVALGLVSS